MSAPSHASKEHSSEGHASACPQSEAQDGQKHVPPERRHPIHLVPREVRNRPVIIFVTTCTAKRRQVLASASAHEAIVTAWCAASTWLVGRYVIMPDHIHLFCAPNGLDAPSLGRWMRLWKSLVTRRMGKSSGALWQRHQSLECRRRHSSLQAQIRVRPQPSIRIGRRDQRIRRFSRCDLREQVEQSGHYE